MCLDNAKLVFIIQALFKNTVMKRLIYPGFLACCLVISLQAYSQLRHNYYFAANNKEVIDSLRNIAIIPAYVELKPDRYENLPDELTAKEEDAALFLQNLLFSALLRTDDAPQSKLQDIYITNEALALHKSNLCRLSLQLSPAAICEMVGADAVLLTLASHDESFVINNSEVAQILNTINWNKPIRRKGFVLVMFHKTDKPLWALAIGHASIQTTIREEYQLLVGDIISLYGYVNQLNN